MFRVALVFVCAMLISGFSLALEPPAGTTQDAPRERIGLVLGGGGARGAAHVGVLKVLERERVKIDFIAGTSMGAIVGGLYASGYKAAEVEKILAGTNWEDVLNDASARLRQPMERKIDSFGLLEAQVGIDTKGLRLPRGLIQGQKLLMTFRQHLHPVAEIKDFDQMPIPFRCVASDLADGSAVVFREGDLPFAIRASMSVPAIFQPVRDANRRMLVDGMLAANVPIETARDMGATRLIVVNVGESLSAVEDINSPISVTNQVLSILMNEKTDAQLKTLTERDLLIRPDLGDTSAGDFPKTPVIIALGEKAAMQQLEKIRSFRASDADYAAFEQSHQLPKSRAEKIAFVRVATDRSRTARNVEIQLSPLLGKTYTPKRVAKAITPIYGDGRYERINYETMRDNAGRLGISVVPVDKGWGPNFLRFGLALDDDFQGSNNYRLSVELRLTGRNKYGGEWRNRLDLGKETGIHSEFLQPYGSRSQFYIRPNIDARVRLRQIGSLGEGEDTYSAEFRQRSYAAGVELGYDFSPSQRLRADLTRGRDFFELQIGPTAQSLPQRSDSSRLGIGYLYDSLDQVSFPRRGIRADLGYRRYFRSLGADSDAKGIRGSIDYAKSFGAHTILAGARLHRPIGDANGVLQLNESLGGFANLSGFSQDARFGVASGLARVVYYRRFRRADKLFDSPVYLGASLEAGNVWANASDASTGDLLTAGSLFFGADTFFGPMYLGYGRASSGDDAVYLSFGSLAFGGR